MNYFLKMVPVLEYNRLSVQKQLVAILRKQLGVILPH